MASIHHKRYYRIDIRPLALQMINVGRDDNFIAMAEQAKVERRRSYLCL